MQRLATTPDPHASVQCWREGAVARLRFNRPHMLNAIDEAVAAAFLQACQQLSQTPGLRVVHVSGAGRAFMAGGDLAALQTDPAGVAGQLIAGMHGGIRLLAELDAPVVAQVHGAVAGGGLGLMLACDLVWAAAGTRFAVAYPQIGASCDCSTSWGLPRVLGLRRATELALLGDTLDAEQARQWGLINRVCPAEHLTAEVDAVIARLAQGPTQALGRLKRLLRSASEHDLGQHLDAEAQGFLACTQTADLREGLAAFLGKRPPVFTGA